MCLVLSSSKGTEIGSVFFWSGRAGLAISSINRKVTKDNFTSESFSQLNVNFLLFALASQAEPSDRAGGNFGCFPSEIECRANFLILNEDDFIPGFDTGFLGRALGQDALHLYRALVAAHLHSKEA